MYGIVNNIRISEISKRNYRPCANIIVSGQITYKLRKDCELRGHEPDFNFCFTSKGLKITFND